jgi:hypothetical protein
MSIAPFGSFVPKIAHHDDAIFEIGQRGQRGRQRNNRGR